jgi:hypothetical protein
VEIYVGSGSQRRLVTAIEVLSPTNKAQGEHGRDLYIRKQQEILGGKVHLVEIDLLRGGQHTTAVPRRFLSRAAADSIISTTSRTTLSTRSRWSSRCPRLRFRCCLVTGL